MEKIPTLSVVTLIEKGGEFELQAGTLSSLKMLHIQVTDKLL